MFEWISLGMYRGDLIFSLIVAFTIGIKSMVISRNDYADHIILAKISYVKYQYLPVYDMYVLITVDVITYMDSRQVRGKAYMVAW